MTLALRIAEIFAVVLVEVVALLVAIAAWAYIAEKAIRLSTARRAHTRRENGGR